MRGKWCWIVVGLGFLGSWCQAQTPKELPALTWEMQRGTADTASMHSLYRIGEYFLNQPDAKPAELNQVVRISQQMEQYSKKIRYWKGLGESQLLRAKALRMLGKSDQGRLSSQRAVTLLSRYGTKVLQAEAFVELGGTYDNTEAELPTKIRYYEKGTQLYHALGNTLKVAQLKEFTGDLYHLNHENTQALRVLNEALALYQSVHYPRLQGIYALLGDVYNEMDRFALSLRYSLMAVKVGEQLKDQGSLMTAIYNRIGINYYSIRNFDEALKYYNKGIALSRQNKDTVGIQNFLVNLSDVLYRKGANRQSLDTLKAAVAIRPLSNAFDVSYVSMQFMHLYLVLGDVAKARGYYQKILTVYTDPANPEVLKQSIRGYLVQYLQMRGQYAESLPYLQRFFEQLPQYPLSLSKRTAMAYRYFKADSALHNYEGAIRQFQRYKSYVDSLNTLENGRQLGLIQVQYETQKKDQDIKLLRQQSELQTTSLQREKVVRNMFLAGICMLLIFLALIYNRYRLKKQSNQKLEAQQNEINEQNDLLRKVLEEKEWLLKEVHHRVKNNLQIVISLLNTQSRYLDNADAVTAIRSSQHRMYAMSLIHQRLYQTETMGSIDMGWYMQELMGYMKESFDIQRQITFQIDCESIVLDVVQAVPLGLILNEAVSNAIKYAFPAGRSGTITVSFKRNPVTGCRLLITDDGVGFPQGYKAFESRSLGMSLMQGLSQQLDGNFEIESSEGGVRVRVDFTCRNFMESSNRTNRWETQNIS
ncbi:tetratricopeptide repeat-containing sensor histidine kinase [Siphonobacter sp.]|uniref:tetratricopeptide repeat-containing sensor histidine kinase n=1 Tax=Siphonobacter sp. TaxID=1869184 RepID=UPI003B3A5B17